jgi:16S rRNA (uracil1498-N3)-methyltransferase
MIRVFVGAEQIVDGRLTLTGADARHIGGALRVVPGETLVAITPDRVQHVSVVIEVSPTAVVALVRASAPSRSEPEVRVTLGVSLLKGDQFERIVEYASEVGVAVIQPILAQRSIVRPAPEKLDERLARWQAIAKSGAALGQRAAIPELLPTRDLLGALESGAMGQRYLLYEGASLGSLSEARIDGDQGVTLFVGPEGGWTGEEVEAARQHGVRPVTLGPRIMRPLPAALTALAVVLHRAGELGQNSS